MAVPNMARRMVVENFMMLLLDVSETEMFETIVKCLSLYTSITGFIVLYISRKFSVKLITLHFANYSSYFSSKTSNYTLI